MKGHSKIELTDVNTGAVQTFENDNMVTNALKYFLADCCQSHNCLTASNIKDKNIWKTLLGGIMLFDTALEENADNVLPHAGMKMIGNGAYGVSNSGAITELGSFNTTESGVQSDGSVKLVYDFSTAQANGTIESCALTSNAGGIIGIGNGTSGKYFASKPTNCDGLDMFYTYSGAYNNLLHPDYSSSNTSSSGLKLVYADATNNCLLWEYDHNPKTNGTIEFRKYGINLSKLNVKYSNTLSDNLLDTITVTVPDDLKTYLNSASSYYRSNPIVCNKNYYRVYCNTQTIAVNGEFYILKIDADMNPTLTKMHNTTGYPLLVEYCNAVINDEWLLIPTTSSTYKHYAIKISDSTIVKYLGTWTPSSYAGGYSYNNVYIDTVNTGARFVDVKNATSYRMSETSSSNAHRYTQCIGNPLLFVHGFGGSGDNYIRFMRYCGYLATINNLATPVTKTATQTMKVTYTLTFD